VENKFRRVDTDLREETYQEYIDGRPKYSDNIAGFINNT
jgi:hypothetical protein